MSDNHTNHGGGSVARANLARRKPRSFVSNVLAVAYKEANVLRHDRALLFTVLAQPIVILFLFGMALSNKPANVPWVVLDQSNSAQSRRVLEEIESTGYFLPRQTAWSRADGRLRLRRGDALAFLIIPKSFRRDMERSRPRVQLLVDGSDPLSAARVALYISQVALRSAAPRDPGERALPAVASAGAVDVRQRFWFNPTLLDRNFFLAALAGQLLTNLCMSVTAGGLVLEREMGTYEQMLALPTTAIEIVLGKVVPYVGLAYAVFFFSMFGAGLLFNIWPAGGWLPLIVVTLPFVVSSLGLGVFVSTLAHTSAQSVFITTFFIMPSFVLSGILMPYQLMPHGIREFGGIFPLRWYQIALRRVVTRGAGLDEIGVPLLVLAALVVIILLATRWRMKPRLG